MRRHQILQRAMQRYWRWQRALTLGARGMVIDADGRILLVRHTYSPGWLFPGGGVELGETILESLGRELQEEANVTLTGRPELFGIFSNAHVFPGDHVALYVVRQWRQESMPTPNREIAEIGFFDPEALPADTTAGTRRRVAELSGGLTPSEMW
jgi:8-oxo-dGTP pyrophosphatase MutT (NUDIX family)